MGAGKRAVDGTYSTSGRVQAAGVRRTEAPVRRHYPPGPAGTFFAASPSVLLSTLSVKLTLLLFTPTWRFFRISAISRGTPGRGIGPLKAARNLSMVFLSSSASWAPLHWIVRLIVVVAPRST